MSGPVNQQELLFAEPAGETLDLLGILRRRKWLIVFSVLLGLALAYLYAAKTEPVYESNARILVVQEKQLPIEGLDSTALLQETLSTHMLVLRSPRVVELAVQSGQLGKLPSLAGSSNVASAIISGLSVRRSESDSNVIQLSYRGTVPDDCAKILTAVVAAYQDFLGQTYRNVSQSTVELITQAKDELHKQLEQKEEKYRDFQKNAPLLWSGENGINVYEQRLTEIEGTRSALMLKINQQKATIKAIEDALASGSNTTALRLMIAQSNTTEAANDPQSQVFQLKLQEKLLVEEQGLGPDHPKVRMIRAQIDAIQNFQSVNRKSSSETDTEFFKLYLASLREGIKADQTRLEQLNDYFKEQETLAKQIRSVQVDAETYRADISRTQSLFETVLKRLEEINLTKDHGGFKTEALSMPAKGKQVEPDEKRILTMGCVLGLLFGAFLAYVVDMADKTFRSPEEIRTKLGWPVLGHLPQIPASTLESIESDSDLQGVDRTIVTFHRPKSQVAEAYRVVRTALYFSLQGEAHKIIQVTSPDPGDGKTTLSANLAVAIAQSNRKTLLLDADFRRPRVHKLFEVPEGVGVTSVLAGTAELVDAVRSTAVENLWVLPRGIRPPNPSELLSSSEFTALLEVLREQYDYIVLDTPPLLAVSDPAVVVPLADTVILTVRVKKSARPAAIRAAEVLASLDATVAGVVVNGVNRKSEYGYAANNYNYRMHVPGYYGYGYGYGYYGDGEYSKYYSDADSTEKPNGVLKPNGELSNGKRH